MAMARCRPLAEISSVQREMNRLFDNLGKVRKNVKSIVGSGVLMWTLRKPLIRSCSLAELPGLHKEDIKRTFYVRLHSYL
jgi:hypothetical protein